MLYVKVRCIIQNKTTATYCLHLSSATLCKKPCSRESSLVFYRPSAKFTTTRFIVATPQWYQRNALPCLATNQAFVPLTNAQFVPQIESCPKHETGRLAFCALLNNVVDWLTFEILCLSKVPRGSEYCKRCKSVDSVSIVVSLRWENEKQHISVVAR